MQSQLQNVINNSLSSSIALTAILPQVQSTAATTSRTGNERGRHEVIRGGKEGYTRHEIRELNKSKLWVSESENLPKCFSFNVPHFLQVKTNGGRKAGSKITRHRP